MSNYGSSVALRNICETLEILILQNERTWLEARIADAEHYDKDLYEHRGKVCEEIAKRTERYES